MNYKKRKHKFEFLLYIINTEGKKSIICQRYFDVEGYNDTVLKSYEAKKMMDECVDIVWSELRLKADDYLYHYHNQYVYQKPEDVNHGTNIYDGEDFFDFEIKVGGRTVGLSRFSANDFPPRVKYDVNIKPIIPELVSLIQHYMSLRKYDTSYLEIESL
jgi:hypothetical protein